MRRNKVAVSHFYGVIEWKEKLLFANMKIFLSTGIRALRLLFC